MTLTLVLSAPTPSLNDQINLHRMQYHRHKKLWALLVREALGNVGYFERPQWKRVSIHIQRMAPGTIADDDNLKGGLKPLYDGLKTWGIIEDDSDKVIVERQIIQVKCSRKVRGQTKVTITPLEPGAP